MANLPVTTNTQSTQSFFNGYYNQPIQLHPGIFEQVYAYFMNKTNSKSAANSLTQALLSLTYNTSLDPIKLLVEFEKSPDISSFKTLLISFFNSTKGATSKLGFKTNINQNPYISRTILP